jgi:ABC-type transporter Mla subunit MlaD
VSLLAQDERLARRVGAIALLVMAATIAGFVFLLDRIEPGSPTRIRVVFRHSAGLHEHAALVIAGQPIGRIEAIVPVLHGAGGLLDGEVGVAVTVAIDDGSAWKVPARAEIFVTSRGPLSDKYLEVAPPVGDPGPAVHDGQELRGIDPPSLDNVLQHTWTNMTTFQLFVETVKPELTALRTQLEALRGQLDGVATDTVSAGGVGALATETRALVATARQTYETSLGGEAGLDRFRAMVADARQVIAQTRAAIDVLGPQAAAIAANLTRIRGHLAASDPIARVEPIITTIRAVLDKVDPLLAKVDELGARIANGEGSIGRLIQDPEFPEDAKDLGKIMKRQPWKILERPPN